jgi:hypothetical protein
MMLELLAASALRSIVFGGVVGLGLKLLRVRNPHMQMAAWTVVLAVSLAMPALTTWIRVTIPAYPSPTPLVKIIYPDTWVPNTWAQSTWAQSTFDPNVSNQSIRENASRIAPEQTVPAERAGASDASPDGPAAKPPHPVDWLFWATLAYLLVAGVLALRLLTGLMLMWHVVRAARPFHDAGAADVRVSNIVAVPVTYAFTVLLPLASAEWGSRKLQAVLEHEGSHVAHGDFFVLLLASVNRTVFWFNPFAWWLSARLADLAEVVSDDAAVDALGDPKCYADVLLDMAINPAIGRAADPVLNPQRLPAGLAMADPHTVRRRVERILAPTTVPAKSGRRRRLLTAIVLVPLGALSAVTIAQSAAPTPADLTDSLAGPRTAELMLGISSALLDRYVGQFETAPSVLTVTRDGERLFAQSTGQPKLRLFAVSDHEFVDELGDTRISFLSDGGRPADAVVLRAPGTSPPHGGGRIDAAKASSVEAAFQQMIDERADRFRNQAAMPGGKAAVGQIIEDLRRNTPTYERMAPGLANKMRGQLSELQPMLRALGALEAIYFRGVGPGGYDIYGVKFANGSGDIRINLGADGIIRDVLIHPDGDGTVGGVASCALEPTLTSSREGIPIRLSLANRSGADIRLFSLDPGGQRAAGDVVATGRSREVLTSVGRPLVVTDRTGQCREIVLPGFLTRVHMIGPSRSGADPGPSAVQRITPLPGSEEALQRHIDSIRRGTPDYDRMTPEAITMTRQQLPQQRAILARLGALRTMWFRGVNLAGDDVYEVLFANGAVVWQIGLLDEGRIGAVALSP